MDERHLRLLPQLFRAPVIGALARDSRSDLLDRVCAGADARTRDAGARGLRALYDDLYSRMVTRYRCEYVFKNSLANKVLRLRHGPHAAALVGELRVDECKADLVVLNGTSTVYEIKTALDNLDRLPTQISTYRRLFDRICVLTEKGAEGRVLRATDDDVGVVVLGTRGGLHTVREPGSNLQNVSPGSVFDCLRASEIRDVLIAEFGECPDVPNGLRYEVRRRLFVGLTPERAHAALVTSLRRRTTLEAASFVGALPRSLKAAGSTVPLSARMREHLLAALAQPYLS